jgi:hypothetical protein
MAQPSGEQAVQPTPPRRRRRCAALRDAIRRRRQSASPDRQSASPDPQSAPPDPQSALPEASEPPDVELVMPFPIGGPAHTSWREHALARAAEYRFLARLLLPRDTDRERQALLAIERHIDIAERAAAGRLKRSERSGAPDGSPEKKLGWWARTIAFLGGAAVERTNSQLDAVEADLLRLARDPYLRGQIPNLVAHVRNHMAPEDPRRQQVEAISEAVRRDPGEKLTALQTDQVLSAVRAASLEARREIRRVRSFRNVLFVTAFILTLGAGGLTVVGVSSPERVPVCFAPDNAMVVCPTAAELVRPTAAGADGDQAAPGSISPREEVHIDEVVRDTARRWDIPVVQIVGLLAAALAGAYTLRSIQGTSTPYSLPVAVAVLKLPTGALTAVFGLLLMRGGFIPGLSALDSSAQIIAWAIVFGYAQQLLTRFVDQQANSVLENVDTPTYPQLGAPAGPPGAPPPAPP